MRTEDRRSTIDRYRSEILTPGPFLAKVVTNIDPMRQGSLEVELLRSVGAQERQDQQTFTVRYLSPFYGVTDHAVAGPDSNEFNHTQKSYGFWAVPPDTGTVVMVIFVENDPSQGYWIGCVQDSYMNHMVPGIAASTSTEPQTRDQDNSRWKDELKNTSEVFGTDFLPVGEINRRSFSSGNSASPNYDIDANKKPVHPMAQVLRDQGTITDPVRGTHTSSSRRDTPSNVFGWSTPGPLDRRINAQKGNIGRANSQINTFVSRLGGHSIVMDDGNDRMLRKSAPYEGPSDYADLEAGEEGGKVNYPKDESFRIRTRTGHQILLHNAEDLIYITNSSGSAWIELTSNGKIDIYAEDSISVRTEQDFNFVADRDFNIHASRAINLYAGTRITALSDDATTIRSAAGVQLSSGTGIQLAGEGNLALNVKSFDIQATNMRLSADTIDILSSGNLHLTGKKNVEIKATEQGLFSSGTTSHFLSGDATIVTAKTIHGTGTDYIWLKGGQIHFNGPTPLLAEQAKEATSAIAGSTGNTGALATTGADNTRGNSGTDGLTMYPLPGVGQVIVKRAPTAEPWLHHENFNPAGFTPDLTDRESSEMPYARNSQRLSIRATSDADSVPAELGGNLGYDGNVASGAGGAVGNKGTGPRRRSMSSNASGSTSDPNNAVITPISDEQLARMPSDWVQDREFLTKVAQVASKYGTTQNEMLGFMHFETAGTMSPAIRNSLGFVGLIQFGRLACQSLSREYRTTITPEMLQRMTRVEQMTWVERYFDMWKRILRLPNPLDSGKMYMIVALPAHSNKPDDTVLYQPNSNVWRCNPSWRDPAANGAITPRGIKRNLGRHVSIITSLLRRGGATPTS